MEKSVLTVEMLADRLMLSDNTIRRYLRSGYLKGFKIGRFWRVSAEEFDRFLVDRSKMIS